MAENNDGIAELLMLGFEFEDEVEPNDEGMTPWIDYALKVSPDLRLIATIWRDLPDLLDSTTKKAFVKRFGDVPVKYSLERTTSITSIGHAWEHYPDYETLLAAVMKELERARTHEETRASTHLG